MTREKGTVKSGPHRGSAPLRIRQYALLNSRYSHLVVAWDRTDARVPDGAGRVATRRPTVLKWSGAFGNGSQRAYRTKGQSSPNRQARKV
ncbi:hypothetical protein Trco_002546 [Trichoderma cornu-damae]|uniref:Uncharacterized protein n=1 Tax=Trichoderma cornu-damae TaxID=654480 RepID=A0A9P8QMV3_9HYPO|nr:hypothetical protein Trco_002546 [Trichoderma cornu-damae]